MGSTIIKMTDRNGNVQYPQSVEKAIYDENGERLDVKMRRLQNTVDAVGAGEPEKIEVTIRKSDYFRYVSNGSENAQSGYFISNPVKLNAGDIIKGSCSGTTRVSFVSLVKEDGSFVASIIAGVAGTKNFAFVASEDMYIEFSGTNGSANDIVKYPSNLLVANHFEPKGGYDRALYEAAGAVYNETTGFYELNGLVDITEEQMSAIYVKFYPALFSDNWFYLFTSNNSNFRTNLKNNGYYYNQRDGVNMRNAFQENKGIEVIDFTSLRSSNLLKVSQITYAFISASKLRVIKGLDCGLVSSFTGAFGSCEALQTVEIQNISKNISFSASPLLSKESILYMIKNSAATSAITVTLHPDAYAMAMADDDIQAALGEKTLVSLASA